ncbi:MAG: rhamnulokinase [Anaerolineae bacterium]|nr:rhamnulokinase [Anaerolineae bacterium]
MAGKHVVAVDLGGESGRVMRATFDGERLQIEEMHRFLNIPVQVGQTLYWDALRIWHEVTTGIKLASQDAASIGVDTWGVDFAFLDRDGNMLANPIHYRDRSSEGMMEWVFERVPRRELYDRTGIQFIAVNGLWRLAYLARHHSPVLEIATTFLTIPDLFNYWLTGSKTCEFTHATTGGFFNAHARNWDLDVLSRLGIPTEMFPPVVQPGTRIGAYEGIPVIVPATHDTGSAVAAVPTTTDRFAYLSSGTWSLLGLEVDAPIMGDVAYEANLTNEGGVYGTFRFLQNIAGMWLLQQCRGAWADEGQQYEYAEMMAMADTAEPFRSFIDPDADEFFQPGDMPALIREFCKRNRQPVPESHAQVVRTVYESLAFKYRYNLERLLRVSGREVDRLHIIGGGSRNTLLCQMTANAIGRVVVAGPGEATALGNAIVQLISLGELQDLAQAREMLSRSDELITYEPQATAVWDEHYHRFAAMLQQKQ